MFTIIYSALPRPSSNGCIVFNLLMHYDKKYALWLDIRKIMIPFTNGTPPADLRFSIGMPLRLVLAHFMKKGRESSSIVQFKSKFLCWAVSKESRTSPAVRPSRGIGVKFWQPRFAICLPNEGRWSFPLYEIKFWNECIKYWLHKLRNMHVMRCGKWNFYMRKK